MLRGLRIVVTRAVHQADQLSASLRALGAEVITLPVVAILPPADLGELRRAVLQANSYDWIIFTSSNGVRSFCDARPEDAGSISTRVAVIGRTTREMAEAYHLRVALTPQQYVAESLLEALADYEWAGRRVLIPRAAVARDLIPDELRRRGAHVDVVEAYRNGVPPAAAAQATELFRAPFPDWVLFASASALENLVALVGADALRHTRIASIGPVTSSAVRNASLSVEAEAQPHTAVGLVAAIVKSAMGS